LQERQRGFFVCTRAEEAHFYFFLSRARAHVLMQINNIRVYSSRVYSRRMAGERPRAKMAALRQNARAAVGSFLFFFRCLPKSESLSRIRALTTNPPLLGHRVLRQVVDSVLHRGDLVGVSVGDLDGKLLLERHDELDDVQGVEPEVLLEAGGGGDLFFCCC